MESDKSYKRGKTPECTCRCSINIEPISGFEPDPANPGKFLWTLKNGRKGTIKVTCPISGSVDGYCTCSEDLNEDWTTVAINRTPAGFPGRLTATVATDGREVEVKATVVGLAQLVVRVDKITIECLSIGSPNVNEPNTTISTSTPGCGGTFANVTVIP